MKTKKIKKVKEIKETRGRKPNLIFPKPVVNMMRISAQPEPEHCRFDWIDFNEKLEWAIMHVLEEGNKEHILVTPSMVTSMDLMAYSYDKAFMQSIKLKSRRVEDIKEKP